MIAVLTIIWHLQITIPHYHLHIRSMMQQHIINTKRTLNHHTSLQLLSFGDFINNSEPARNRTITWDILYVLIIIVYPPETSFVESPPPYHHPANHSVNIQPILQQPRQGQQGQYIHFMDDTNQDNNNTRQKDWAVVLIDSTNKIIEECSCYLDAAKIFPFAQYFILLNTSITNDNKISLLTSSLFQKNETEAVILNVAIPLLTELVKMKSDVAPGKNIQCCYWHNDNDNDNDDDGHPTAKANILPYLFKSAATRNAIISMEQQLSLVSNICSSFFLFERDEYLNNYYNLNDKNKSRIISTATGIQALSLPPHIFLQTSATHNPLHPEKNENIIMACFVVTFKKPSSGDEIKVVAHHNMARAYKMLEPYIQTFLALTPVSSSYELEVWIKAGHHPTLSVLNDTETNEHNTPHLRSLLQQVERACPSSASFVAYANADILFDYSLIHTLLALKTWSVRTEHQNNLVIVGRRLNFNLLDIPLTDQENIQYFFKDKNIHENYKPTKGKNFFKKEILENANLFTETAQDYFIISRESLLIRGINIHTWPLPNYVIGRRAYDNAVVDWAYHHACLVDATFTVNAVHQTTRDGNFAGHSPANADKEYNVNLPGAVYDHFSTTIARFETVFSIVEDQQSNMKQMENDLVVIEIKDRINKGNLVF